MSWSVKHAESERLASAAETALRGGHSDEAKRLFRAAGEAECAAFRRLEPTKERTRGITAVSAVSLLYKAKDLSSARHFALGCLSAEKLPDFAVAQIEDLLQTVWSEQALVAAGLKFAKEDVFVSVRGGEVLVGGAPLDLILRKVEEVRAVFYRTVELMMGLPLRQRGGPSYEIQQLFRPWLFQAPAHSYQFAVRLESPKQMELGLVPQKVPPVDEVTRMFVEIINSAAFDPEGSLVASVPDEGYRNTFLKLARNLTPSGKSFSELEIYSQVRPEAGSIVLRPDARETINSALKKRQPPVADDGGERVQLVGVLRALDLDHDWIEVTVMDQGQKHVRVEKAGEVIDDVVGPMVNRRVTVEALRKADGRHVFRDIQPVE